MKIRCFHLISRVAVQKDDTYDASHLTISDRIRKNVKNVHLKTSEDSS